MRYIRSGINNTYMVTVGTIVTSNCHMYSKYLYVYIYVHKHVFVFNFEHNYNG